MRESPERAGVERPRDVGDRIEVERRHAGSTLLGGEIVEVLGEGEHRHYRVKWDDGHESVYYPHEERSGPGRLKRPAEPARGEGRTPEPPPPTLHARPGDRLVIHPHHLGEPGRDAEVLETFGPDGGPPFRVRWSDDGRETTLFPGSDASIAPAGRDIGRARDAP